GPLRSAKTAEWMRKNVPGMHVPDSIIERLKGAKDQAQEGRNICVELIQSIHAMHGVAGVHIMAYRQEESVAEIVDRSGILQGRAPWFPERDSLQISHRTTS
ncbi:MAG TPA: methylenetetrahydrofolate reductase, partial [Steroidobacteraceae bacterium]